MKLPDFVVILVGMLAFPQVWGEASPEPEAEPEATTMMATMMSSSPMSVAMGSTTVRDLTDYSEEHDSTMMPGDGGKMDTSTEKGFKGKVKDAVSSAEGWIKNAGQNIKESWNKAKESVKETASNVKEKVKKGMTAGHDKVAEAINGPDCGKDPKCTTDSTNMENSSMSSEENMPTTMPTTNTPGYKKTRRRRRRDLYGNNRYNSYNSNPRGSGIYATRYSGVNGDRDSSDDSDEYSWSKTISHSNVNRRYRRNPSMMNTATENSTSTPENSDGQQRHRRESDSKKTTTSQTSSTTTSTSSGNNGNSNTESNGDSSSRSNGRHRRDSNSMKTQESFLNTTESSEEDSGYGFDSRDKSSNNKWGGNGGGGGSSSSRSNFSISVHLTGGGIPSEQNPSSISSSSSSTNSSTFESSRNDSGGKGGIHFDSPETQMDHPPIFRADSNSRPRMDSKSFVKTNNGNVNGRVTRRRHVGQMGYMMPGSEYPMDEYGSFHLPIIEGDALEITTGSWNSEDSHSGGNAEYFQHYEQQHHNAQYHDREETIAEGNLDEGSHSGGGGEHNHHHNNHGGQHGGGMHGISSTTTHLPHSTNKGGSKHHKSQHQMHYHENHGYLAHGQVTDTDAEKQTEHGTCRPIASAKKCNNLQLDSAQCLYDTDCSGTKKCCFYHCDPYKIIGVCEHVQYTVTKSR